MSSTRNPIVPSAQATDFAAAKRASEESASEGQSSAPVGEASVTGGSNPPGILLDERTIGEPFEGVDLTCHNQFLILSTRDKISLTERRISTKREVKLCGIPIADTEESFLYQDLQHISVNSEHRLGFFVGGLLLLYAQSGLLLDGGAFLIFLAVVMILVGALALLYFLSGLCDRGALSLDFHRKGVTNRWFSLSSPIFRARDGTSFTKTIHLSEEDRATLTRMIYEHPLSNFSMSHLNPEDTSYQKGCNVEMRPLPPPVNEDTPREDGLQLMSGERMEGSFSGSDVTGTYDAGLCFTKLALTKHRLYLTNKRIIIKKCLWICGVPISSSEASFLYQDLQHISVKMKRKKRFVVGGVAYLVAGAVWNTLTSSDAATSMSVSFILLGIVLLLSIAQFFIAKPMLHLDFYKEGTVNQWLSGLDAISVLKKGSAVTEAVHLSKSDLLTVTHMLYGHPLAQYVEDRERC